MTRIPTLGDTMHRFMMIALLASLSACTGAAVEAPSPPPDVVQTTGDAAPIPAQVMKAATVAKAIRADPENATAVLSANGMTAKDLDELMYEIASDPMLSDAYAKATSE